MTRIRRLYDKDQEVIIFKPIIVPLQIFLLDWLESGNLEIGNMKTFPTKENLGKNTNAQFLHNQTISNEREKKSFLGIGKINN